jgi:molybdopterin synthase catalytic subunit
MKITIRFVSGPLVPEMAVWPTDGASGAILDFYGIVRREENERVLTALDYEAYQSLAQKELARIAEDLSARFPGQEITVIHALGTVPVGQPSLHIRVRARNRAEAFGLAQNLIDQMKQTVPIWKKTVF